MRILSLLILACSIILTRLSPDHPHGQGFKISCDKCHSPKGWHLDREIYSFDHSATRLPLEGQHQAVDCRGCHKSLVFSEAETGCADCHNDVHEGTTGSDCARCHTPQSWLVSNINEIHRLSRFPLLGAHRGADCFQCHKSASLSRFDVMGINCIDCHMADYQSTTSPNHAMAGFSQDCLVCHSVNAFSWNGAGFSHSFFPLTLGHSVSICTDCHKGVTYSDISADCWSCHQSDFNAAANPSHSSLGFSIICTQCHTTNPGWKPASFREHDAKSFPIYSGRHKGTWDSCTECHSNPSSYAQFTCLSCHEHNKTDMDRKHQEESGYSYASSACYNCHPRGVADD